MSYKSYNKRIEISPITLFCYRTDCESIIVVAATCISFLLTISLWQEANANSTKTKDFTNFPILSIILVFLFAKLSNDSSTLAFN